MSSRASEPQCLRDLSPEDRRAYEEWSASLDLIDADDVLPLSPWEERLLGRLLEDVPTGDGRNDWRKWRIGHRLPIDKLISSGLESGSKTYRIDTKKLAATWEAGWCPHYMARCHIVYAAIAANLSLNLSHWDEELAESSRHIIGTTASNPNSEAQNPIRSKRRNSKRQLSAEADQYRRLIKSLAECEGLNEPQIVEVCVERYRRDLSALTALSRSKYGQALGEARAKRVELIKALGALADLADEADAMFDSDDASLWQREFIRFMAPGYARLTGLRLAESAPCIMFMSAAYNSLLKVPDNDWSQYLPKAEQNRWCNKIRMAKKFDENLDAPDIEGIAPKDRVYANQTRAEYSHRFSQPPFHKRTKDQSR